MFLCKTTAKEGSWAWGNGFNQPHWHLASLVTRAGLLSCLTEESLANSPPVNTQTDHENFTIDWGGGEPHHRTTFVLHFHKAFSCSEWHCKCWQWLPPVHSISVKKCIVLLTELSGNWFFKLVHTGMQDGVFASLIFLSFPHAWCGGLFCFSCYSSTLRDIHQKPESLGAEAMCPDRNHYMQATWAKHTCCPEWQLGMRLDFFFTCWMHVRIVPTKGAEVAETEVLYWSP